jgi:hypothetical protein
MTYLTASPKEKVVEAKYDYEFAQISDAEVASLPLTDDIARNAKPLVHVAPAKDIPVE